MPQVAVYRFNDNTREDNVSPRFATLKAIKMFNGRNIEETRRVVDSSGLYSNGTDTPLGIFGFAVNASGQVCDRRVQLRRPRYTVLRWPLCWVDAVIISRENPRPWAATVFPPSP
jgi:hypothetical protein